MSKRLVGRLQENSKVVMVQVGAQGNCIIRHQQLVLAACRGPWSQPMPSRLFLYKSFHTSSMPVAIYQETSLGRASREGTWTLGLCICHLFAVVCSKNTTAEVRVPWLSLSNRNNTQRIQLSLLCAEDVIHLLAITSSLLTDIFSSFGASLE